ncbi:hypothetical protein Ancab_013755 [Ancistrocladus abbreviatus]
MEDLKKRKLDDYEVEKKGQISSISSEEQRFRSLQEPLAKSQFVDLLAKLWASVASGGRGGNDIVVWETNFLPNEKEKQERVKLKKGLSSLTKQLENLMVVAGHMAVCNVACEGLSSANTTADEAQTKLYLGGLSPDTASEMLLNSFGSGFGFITYRTVEAAKKALDDPERTLGGRNITVKYADNKSRIVQVQLPPEVIPMTIAMASSFPQPTERQAPLPLWVMERHICNATDDACGNAQLPTLHGKTISPSRLKNKLVFTKLYISG